MDCGPPGSSVLGISQGRILEWVAMPFSRIDHILGHKSKLDKFKKIEIIPSIFSDHNAVRLDVNYRRKTIKNSNILRLKNTLLNITTLVN